MHIIIWYYIEWIYIRLNSSSRSVFWAVQYKMGILLFDILSCNYILGLVQVQNLCFGQYKIKHAYQYLILYCIASRSMFQAVQIKTFISLCFDIISRNHILGFQVQDPCFGQYNIKRACHYLILYCVTILAVIAQRFF